MCSIRPAGFFAWSPVSGRRRCRTPIMGGLIVATVLTLVFLPALYAAWFKVRADEPAREAVTPPHPTAPAAA